MKLKKNIYLMYAIVLLQGMVFYGPVATLYRQARGVTVFQITLIEGISYLLCIALEIPWGILADRIGYKKTMVFCSGLFFVSKLIFWRAAGFAGFLLERVLLSIVIAGLSGVDTSVLYLSCGEGESQRIFGIYNALGILGLLAASLVFSLFVKDNYNAAAWLTVISYGAAAVLSLFLEEVAPRERSRIRFGAFREILARVLRSGRLLLFLTAVAFLSQAQQTITVFLNQLQYEKCGLSPSAMGYIYILVTLAGLLGAFSHRLTRRSGVRSTGVRLYLAAALCCLALGLTGSAPISVGSIIGLNIAGSLFQPLQTELQNRQVRSENRATELSVYAMIVDCISAGTSVVFGAFAKAALEAAFFFGAGICLAGVCLFLIWYRKQPETRLPMGAEIEKCTEASSLPGKKVWEFPD